MKRREFVQAGLLTAVGPEADNKAKPEAVRKPAEIVDAHCHAGSGMNLHRDHATTDPWTTFNDPLRTLRRMEEAGIDRTIIFPISNISYGRANEEIAGYVQRWPDRFIGFAKHDPGGDQRAVAKRLRYEVNQLGLRGLKLHGVPSIEMVDAAADLRIPILFHPPRVEQSLTVIRASPGVSFILAHLGNFASNDWREHVRAIKAVKEIPNLYMETSSVVFVDYLEQAARELPAEKLIFGSDGPLLDSRVELYKIRLLKLAPEHEALVLGGNILRLLKR